MTLSPNTQITQENVGLLKAGDWLRVVDASSSDFTAGALVQIEDWEDTGKSRVPIINYLSWRLSRFTYIGPDLGDGWIGWSGGENPVPGQMVDVRYGDGIHSKVPFPSDGEFWRHEDKDTDIIAFRPALSRPAEGVSEAAPDALNPVAWRYRPRSVSPYGLWSYSGTEWSETDKYWEAEPLVTKRSALAALAELATPTPAPVDHIGDATEMMAVDWERVGTKLATEIVQHEEDAKKNPLGGLTIGGLMDARDNHGVVYQSQALADTIATARAAIAAAQPEGK